MPGAPEAGHGMRAHEDGEPEALLLYFEQLGEGAVVGPIHLVEPAPELVTRERPQEGWARFGRASPDESVGCRRGRAAVDRPAIDIGLAEIEIEDVAEELLS